MKAILFVLFILILFDTSSFAQPDNKVRFGVKAGGNFTGRMFETGASTDNDRKLIPNFHLGVVSKIPISLDWSVQPEVQFLRAGYKTSHLKDGVCADTTQRVSYLKVPVSFNYCFRNVNVKPYLSIGPYFGYALGGTVKSKIKENEVVTKSSRSIDFGKNGQDHLKRFDAGFVLGAGMDLDFFNLEFKYSQSILNQYAGSDDSVYSVNMNLALSIIVLF